MIQYAGPLNEILTVAMLEIKFCNWNVAISIRAIIALNSWRILWSYHRW